MYFLKTDLWCFNVYTATAAAVSLSHVRLCMHPYRRSAFIPGILQARVLEWAAAPLTILLETAKPKDRKDSQCYFCIYPPKH